MDAKKTGALIAEIRKENGKTQKDLARELHVSNAAISKWERGIGFPDITLIEPLAKCLDISIAELFNGERRKASDSTNMEKTIADIISVSSASVTRRKKIMNWCIAIATALLYLTISLITQKWELTWIVWLAYCLYRILIKEVLA